MHILGGDQVQNDIESMKKKQKAIRGVKVMLHLWKPSLKVHERHKKSTIFILTFLESETTTVAKYKVDANDEAHMADQMKRNLTTHLVKFSAYDVGSQIGKGRK